MTQIRLQALLRTRPATQDAGNRTNRLNVPEASERVRAQREQSRILPALRQRLRARFDGARCCIIGSAPGIVAPPRRPGDRYVCANGSVKSAAALGIDRPDLTAITGHATNLQQDVSLANVGAWRNRQTAELVFILNGDTTEHAREVFAHADFRFCHFTPLNVYERAAIIEDVAGVELGLGRRDDRISMGIFSAVLAMWGGAAEIVLCGFSLQGGHSHVWASTPRHHVGGDTRFLEILPSLPVRSSTTASELQQRFGLPPPA